MAYRYSRRRFLRGAGAAALASAAPTGAWAQAAPPPKQRVRLGIIGTGGRGEANWTALAAEEIVVLCDVDLARTERAREKFPRAAVVQDFRRVLDRQDVDAVVVSTPDHWHALPSVWAMQAGKHVYCEKPLARTVYECRLMAETAARHKVITQMGTQIHASANYRRVVELVRAGAIGAIRSVDVWCQDRPSPGKRSADTPPPATLDYELWVGPAEYRPYDPKVVPFHWRWWWEFGGGVLADMGCHYMDLPHWALDLRHPERVAATGEALKDADNLVPAEMRVDFHYPARGERPPVHLRWWHGVTGPRGEDGAVKALGLPSGVLFHGEKGQLLADYDTHKLLPEEQFREYKRPEPTLKDSVGHQQEWIDAIRGGPAPLCSFDYSGALAETVLLGNVAYRLGREVAWDAARLEITNVPKTDWEALIRPAYRVPWTLQRP